ncbi:hypothetical protein [Lyngbya sp. CCAP 1446/10]|nr:hypothetical protein [Lyngbya sp. CCAP 1446/10]
MKSAILAYPEFQKTDRTDRLNQKSVSTRSIVVSDCIVFLN